MPVETVPKSAPKRSWMLPGPPPHRILPQRCAISFKLAPYILQLQLRECIEHAVCDYVQCTLMIRSEAPYGLSIVAPKPFSLLWIRSASPAFENALPADVPPQVCRSPFSPFSWQQRTFTGVVRVPYRTGATFTACTPGTSPDPQSPCDPGATAVDEEEGDLSDAVVVSPAAVSLEAAVGTRVRLKYSVSDNGLPRLSATAYRILEIVSPCTAAAKYFCDGVCKQVCCHGSLPHVTVL